MTHPKSRLSNARAVATALVVALSLIAGMAPTSPAAAATVTLVSGTVTYSSTTTVESGEVLSFDPAKNTTLEVAGNLIVEGTLEMKPQPGVIHTLRFVGVDEAAFVGGGMEVLESDRGLWVVGAGRLDLVGAEKQGWNRTGTDPSWEAGDELVVAPTSVGDYGSNGFKSFTSGSPVPRADSSLPPAEVLNLTRSVRIEGTPTGRSHVTIMSSVPQTIRFVALRHMGPRQASEDVTDGVAGRYPIHFHMNGDGSRGSMVEGNVIRESGNRAIVPHSSHGITLLDNVAYDVFEIPYWWDLGTENDTDDSLWIDNFAGYVRTDPVFRGFNLAGFNFGLGEGNVATGNAAAGVQGNKNCAGFRWPSQGSDLWVFQDNVAHNNRCHGIHVWQNNSNDHHIDEFIGYRNKVAGINHGAYTNEYTYTNLYLYENGEAGLQVHAFSSLPAPGHVLQSFSCVTVAETPVAVRILPSAAPVEGAPTSFNYLNLVNTPTLVEVEQAALDQGQTLEKRAVFNHLGEPCPADFDPFEDIPGSESGTNGTFKDDDGNIHEANIEIIAAAGITLGCNPPTNDLYCPKATVTRGQMAAFMVRAFDLPASSQNRFSDDDGSVFEADIQALAAAGITVGCNPPANTEFCPSTPIDRAQMATFLVRALKLPLGGAKDFTDDDGSIHEPAIEALAEAGITLGCNPPANTEFCPSSAVLRDQMASFLARSIALQ